MKLELQNPSAQATVDYFVAMAKGQTTSTTSTKRNGLGVVTKQTTTYHVVTPTDRVIAHAQTKAPSEVIRRGTKKKTKAPSEDSGKKKSKYSMPGLD